MERRHDMSKQTYYIVQATPTHYVHEGINVGYGMDDAAQLTIGEARRILNILAARAQELGMSARRFPRIIKITVEAKTITAKHRKGTQS